MSNGRRLRRGLLVGVGLGATVGVVGPVTTSAGANPVHHLVSDCGSNRTWHFQNESQFVQGGKDYRSEIRDGFASWNQAGGLTGEQIVNVTEGAGGIEARAYVFPVGDNRMAFASGDCTHLDFNHSYMPYTVFQYAGVLAAHEMGHTFGLGHSGLFDNAMAPPLANPTPSEARQGRYPIMDTCIPAARLGNNIPIDSASNTALTADDWSALQNRQTTVGPLVNGGFDRGAFSWKASGTMTLAQGSNSYGGATTNGYTGQYHLEMTGYSSGSYLYQRQSLSFRPGREKAVTGSVTQSSADEGTGRVRVKLLKRNFAYPADAAQQHCQWPDGANAQAVDGNLRTYPNGSSFQVVSETVITMSNYEWKDFSLYGDFGAENNDLGNYDWELRIEPIDGDMVGVDDLVVAG